VNIVKIVVLFIVSVVLTAVVGMLSKWIDRKVTARVQWRVGPPWYQPVADFLKLLGKETVIPEAARGTGFLMAPVVAFAATCAAATILWAPTFGLMEGFGGDVIVVLYLLTIPALALIYGGSASGNPNGAAGASREMKLMLAYELPFILAILAAVVGSTPGTGAGVEGAEAAGPPSFSLAALVGAETGGVPASIGVLLAFLVGLLAVQAKLGLVPFDIAEAEGEIMSGPYVEYSGPPLALWYLTRAMLFALLPVFLITIFWGGISFKAPDGGVLASIGTGLASIVKYVVVLVLIILIRNTNPRVRIDHAMKFFWFLLTPVAVLALVLSL